MKRLVITLAVALSLAVPSLALACDGHGETQASVEPKKVTVNDVVALTRGKKATPVDANAQETRAKNGVIPGAVLLTSSTEYALKELPADKASKLVFYCASQKCTASHMAARKALEAGYTDVAVMPDGIRGWKEAGQPTAKPNS